MQDELCGLTFTIGSPASLRHLDYYKTELIFWGPIRDMHIHMLDVLPVARKSLVAKALAQRSVRGSGKVLIALNPTKKRIIVC